jgi:hypothetical protein
MFSKIIVFPPIIIRNTQLRPMHKKLRILILAHSVRILFAVQTVQQNDVITLHLIVLLIGIKILVSRR